MSSPNTDNATPDRANQENALKAVDDARAANMRYMYVSNYDESSSWERLPQYFDAFIQKIKTQRLTRKN